jgi:alkylation response protein AidB-like acyl-CoA dehydrogenase
VTLGQSVGGAAARHTFGSIHDPLSVWRSKQLDQPVQRDQLVKLWIESEVNRLTTQRANQMRTRGTPGPEGSVSKLAFAAFNKRLSEFVMELLGPEAMLYPSGYETTDPEAGKERGSLQRVFLRTRANSIEGGTSEIMRNIIGERTLGLPGDVRIDKDVPWKQVPRN